MDKALPIGTQVKVELFGGQVIHATIDYWDSQIKNGRPGYDLINCSDGHNHWCYQDQVVAVL